MNTRKLLPLLRWLPALLWMGVLFYWSSQSVLPIDGRIDSSQLHEQAHLISYSVLGLLLALGSGADRRGLVLAWLLTTLYGLTDELHQTFVPIRQGRLEDAGMDSVYAAMALMLFAGLRWMMVRGRGDAERAALSPHRRAPSATDPLNRM